MAVFQLDDGRWLCYYKKGTNPDDPERTREYFGRGRKGELAAWNRNAELGLGREIRRRRKPQVSFEDLAQAYYEKKVFSENSRRHLKGRLDNSILPFFGHRPAMSLNDDVLDAYVQHRRKAGNKNYKNRKDAPPVKFSTINRELTDVKAIMNFGAKRKPPLIPWNPIRDYKKPDNDYAIIDPPTEEEAKKIIEAATPTLARAIVLAFYMGLRPGAVELLTLTWVSVNFRRRTILVISADKGGIDRRYVPIHEALMPMLKAWKAADKNDDGPIVHYKGKPITKLQKSWERALARAGIRRRLRPYDLRHHFVTRALEGGADLKALSEVVGSSPETIWRHYQHVTKEIHRRTVATVPEVQLGETIPGLHKEKKGGKK